MIPDIPDVFALIGMVVGILLSARYFGNTKEETK